MRVVRFHLILLLCLLSFRALPAQESGSALYQGNNIDLPFSREMNPLSGAPVQQSASSNVVPHNSSAPFIDPPYLALGNGPRESVFPNSPYIPSNSEGYVREFFEKERASSNVFCGYPPEKNYSPAISIVPGYPNYDSWSNQPLAPWKWQILPEGLIYPSYLAGPQEPRLCGVWNYERDWGWMCDATLGGRASVLRYGTQNSVLPEGFEIAVEGGAHLRLDYERDMDMLATDYRVGVPLTYGTKRFQYKLAYYHVSSHLGDEYILRKDPNPKRDRINYVRDSIVLGIAYRPHRDIRLYGETACAFYRGDKTDPWEFQFGIEYSPNYPSNGIYGAPFFAINAHLLQELDFGGNLTVQLGWQWRGPSNHLFRMGVQYLCGASDQYEFNEYYESKIGMGIWFDF